MQDIEQLLQEALELGDQGSWAEMADVLARGLKESPNDPYLLCWLGVAQRELGNDGVAYEYFRRCLAEEPSDPHILALAGSGLAALDDPEAESVLRLAALSAPDVPMARLQYGAYLAREGLFEEAMIHLRAAVDLAPDDPAMHSELGTALALQGDAQGAITELETTLELAPDDSWSRLLLGLLYAEQGRLEEAAEELVRAAEERQDDAEAHVLAALASAAVGWEEAAQTALVRAGYVAQRADAQLLEEAEERVAEGPESARGMLLETVGPSVLRERLSQPL
ncbi:MAG TPA: tetratricopeptide repeat protein [Longimicrobiales bacterium]